MVRVAMMALVGCPSAAIVMDTIVAAGVVPVDRQHKCARQGGACPERCLAVPLAATGRGILRGDAS